MIEEIASTAIAVADCWTSPQDLVGPALRETVSVLLGAAS
jgi:hypothetical protein